MDNLRDFISENRSAFEETENRNIRIANKLYKNTLNKRVNKILWSVTSVAAALITAFVSIAYHDRVNSIEYQLEYYENARAELIVKILETAHNTEEAQRVIDIVLRERTPMIEQIPEYLSENSKIEIIERYESRRLSALEQLL